MSEEVVDVWPVDAVTGSHDLPILTLLFGGAEQAGIPEERNGGRDIAEPLADYTEAVSSR